MYSGVEKLGISGVSYAPGRRFKSCPRNHSCVVQRKNRGLIPLQQWFDSTHRDARERSKDRTLTHPNMIGWTHERVRIALCPGLPRVEARTHPKTEPLSLDRGFLLVIGNSTVKFLRNVRKRYAVAFGARKSGVRSSPFRHRE